MLKAIHASEDKETGLTKAEAVIEKLEEMRINESGGKIHEGIEKALTDLLTFPCPAPMTDPHQQSTGTGHARDLATHSGSWHLS